MYDDEVLFEEIFKSFLEGVKWRVHLNKIWDILDLENGYQIQLSY